jgi:hypothetical protein
MATRVKLELDPETYGLLMRAAVAEKRPADWQAEVLLRRALGTWDEPRIGYEVPTGQLPKPATNEREVEHVPA